MRTCSIAGCDRKHNARGLCTAHYLKWMKYGDPLGSSKLGRPKNDIDSFWKKVDKSEYCWEWQAALDSDGYGVFSLNDKSIKAHRFVAEFVMGLDISDLCVCHKCDNRKCVNPDHLFLGTQMDNSRDRDAKGRSVKGRKQSKSHIEKKARSKILSGMVKRVIELELELDV